MRCCFRFIKCAYRGFNPRPERRCPLPLLKAQEAVRTAIARRTVLRVGGIGQVRGVARDDALAVATSAQVRVVVVHGLVAARSLATAGVGCRSRQGQTRAAWLVVS